jgi:hypothetical protein
MLQNAKHTYALADFTVERRPKGWYFTRTARYGDRAEWRGPYSSIASVSLMVARELSKEIARRDSPCNVD